MIEYSRELVISKIKKDFNTKYGELAKSDLELYGTENHELERERVQMAILKLANGNIDELSRLVKIAKKDYRDVIALAEYPEETKFNNVKGIDSTELEIIRKRDRRQYLDWLKS
jgi:hypothetical protein